MSHKISVKQWPLSDTTNFHSKPSGSAFEACSVLPGLNVAGNNIVNMYFGHISSQVSSSTKRRRIMHDSDED